MNANYLVIKFSDNDFTWDIELALKLLWSVYGEDTKRQLLKVHGKGWLKDILVDLFDHMNVTAGIIHDMRMVKWRNSASAKTRPSIKEYLSTLEVLFFENKSDFYEWKNGEWVYLDLCTGEVATF